MILSKFRTISLALLALIIFGFLYFKSQAIDFEQHNRFSLYLRRIKEVDAVLNQDIFKARYGLLTYYDPIVNELAEINKLQSQLNQIPDFIDRKGKLEIHQLLEKRAEIFSQKERKIERFKLQNAILNTSLRYFPIAIADLADKAGSKDRRLEDRLNQLLENILIYNLNTSEDKAPKINQQIDSLLVVKDLYEDQSKSNELERVLLHGRLILVNKPELDDLLEDLLTLPVGKVSEEITKTYDIYYEQALKNTTLYRIYLSLFSVALVGSIAAYIIVRLRKLTQTVSDASKKLQASLEATQQAEEKYRSIFENSTDGIFQSNPEGRFINANSTLAKLYGVDSPSELIDNIENINQQIYVDPQRRAEFIAAMTENEAIAQFESQIYRRDGSIIWISENVRNVRDANGKFLYYEGTAQDITERKRVELMLQDSEDRLRRQQTALIELARCQPLYTGDLPAAIVEIIKTAAETLNVERASVWMYSSDRTTLYCVNLYELSSQTYYSGLEITETDYPQYFQALEENRAIAADNASLDSRTSEFAESYLPAFGITSMLDVPIRLGGTTAGVICLEHTGTVREWVLEEENFASYLAYMASLAMEASDRAKAELALRQEQEKVEQLLLNILPQPIAERLKSQPGAIADSFEEVTVLFADLVGFTQVSARISAAELVAVLNEIFSAFDQLAECYGLEKIKTIGDAYMVVGGLPMPRSDHAEAIAEMALAIQQEISRFKTQSGEAFQIRMGISTGSVVAGVIGIKKFIYDLWGDTVNTASRMESQGLPGCIQVTSDTYERLQDKYHFEARGIIEVKGKGAMNTYFLKGKKTGVELAE